MRGACQELLARLSTWSPTGPTPARRNSREFSGFSPPAATTSSRQAVARINRALTTESYRSGDVDNAGADELDMFPADPRQLEHQPATQRDRPYFEVLVVEKMTEAQERALRNEVRRWRRPDDEFVYELVVVASGDEALIAARLNVNLQAVVIRRRFSHQSTRDLSALAEFVDSRGVARVGRSPVARRTRADPRGVAGQAAARTRPVPDDRDRGGGHRRAAGPVLPPGVPRPGRHARAAPVDPAGCGGALPHAVLQRAQAVQPPAHGGLSRAADFAGQVDRQLALDQGHGRLLRPGRVHGRDVGHLRRSGLAAGADRARCAKPNSWPRKPTARATRTSSPTEPRRPTRSSPRRWWRPATSCCWTATATSPITTG